MSGTVRHQILSRKFKINVLGVIQKLDRLVANRGQRDRILQTLLQRGNNGIGAAGLEREFVTRTVSALRLRDLDGTMLLSTVVHFGTPKTILACKFTTMKIIKERTHNNWKQNNFHRREYKILKTNEAVWDTKMIAMRPEKKL